MVILLMEKIPLTGWYGKYPIIYIYFARFYTSNRWLEMGFLNHQQYGEYGLGNKSKVVSTHLWNTPVNLYQRAMKGFLS